MKNLTPSQSRLIAVALLVFVVGLSYRAILVPIWTTITEDREAIRQQQDLIMRFNRIAAGIDELEVELNDLKRRQDVGRFTLSGESTTLAAAALQERVKSVVEEHNGRLTSTQVLNVEQQQGFEQVSINVRMSVDTPTLQRVVHALENGLPVTLIEDVTILARRNRSRRRRTTPPPALDVRFKLTGYMFAGAGVSDS